MYIVIFIESKKENYIIDLNSIPVKEDNTPIETTNSTDENTDISLTDQREQLEQLIEEVIASTQAQSTEEKGQARVLKPRK